MNNRNHILFIILVIDSIMSRPNKCVSSFIFQMPSNKLSDFLDPNLNGLMNQLEQLNGEEQENAIIEAFRVLIFIYNYPIGLSRW